MSKDINTIVNTIIENYEIVTIEFAHKSTLLIKGAIMNRMAKKPYPKSFVSAMGATFFVDAKNENRDIDKPMPRTKDILLACEAHEEKFGTLGWRVDREGTELVENKW